MIVNIRGIPDRTKVSGGPEHWLGTALVPPLTHISTTDPRFSKGSVQFGIALRP